MNSTTAHPERVLTIRCGSNNKKLVIPAMLPGKNTVVKMQISDWEQNDLKYYLNNKEFKVFPKGK